MATAGLLSQTDRPTSWSEVCGRLHDSAEAPARGHEGISGRRSHEELARIRTRAAVAGERARGAGRGTSQCGRPAARAASGVHACYVSAEPGPRIADDVPTWVLLTCGIVLGVVMLLAMVFIGGPSYA